MSGVFVVLVLALAISVQGLDLDGAKGQPCFPITQRVNADVEWVSTVDKWYSPLISRYALYQASIDLTKRDPIYISEDEIFYDSCLTWKMYMTALSTSGFGGKRCTYRTKPTGKAFDSFDFSMNGGNSGSCSVTLTDNKTYNFAACCLADGQMIWTVTSPYKTLSETVEQKVLEHAQALGFKKENFARLRYDSCKDANKNVPKTEL